MGKNVSVEDQLLAAIAPGRSIGRELVLSAYLKISKLQSRVDELTKAKGELLQKLAKAENQYKLLEAHNQEKEQAAAAYNEGIGACLDKMHFEVVLSEPGFQQKTVEMQPSSFLSSLTADTPKPARDPLSLAPTLVADSLVNENDTTLRKVYVIYAEDDDSNQEKPRIGFDLEGLSRTFVALRKCCVTAYKLWFVEFRVPRQFSFEQIKKHVQAMERQAKAYASYVNGLVPMPTVPPIKPQKADAVVVGEPKPETNSQKPDVMLSAEHFQNLCTASKFLFGALGSQHPICKLLSSYTFCRG